MMQNIDLQQVNIFPAAGFVATGISYMCVRVFVGTELSLKKNHQSLEGLSFLCRSLQVHASRARKTGKEEAQIRIETCLQAHLLVCAPLAVVVVLFSFLCLLSICVLEGGVFSVPSYICLKPLQFSTDASP